MTEQRAEQRRAIEDRLAKPMFALAILFLLLVAASIEVARSGDVFGGDQWSVQWVIGSLLLLWPLFLVEAAVRYYLGSSDRHTWKALSVCLAGGLLPPLRMAAPSRTRPRHLWLPWLGWHEIDFDLQKLLERTFSGPMFFMALLILPLLGIEYFWSEAVESNRWLWVALRIGVGLIWIAFTIEFIIRISAAESKLGYAFNHWVDLAVVLLPMVEFMPFLRVLRATRVMRLKTIAQMAKYYRMYGLAGKGWRGLVVWEVIHQLWSGSPQARLTRLRGQLEDKQYEIRDLEREVDYFRRRIQAVQQELAAQGKRPPEEVPANQPTSAPPPEDRASNRG